MSNRIEAEREFVASRVLDSRVALSAAEREALKTARLNWELTAKEVGRKMNVAWRTLYSWESGERRPTSEQLVAWWKAVGP